MNRKDSYELLERVKAELLIGPQASVEAARVAVGGALGGYYENKRHARAYPHSRVTHPGPLKN